jgi:hypothetical protein
MRKGNVLMRDVEATTFKGRGHTIDNQGTAMRVIKW